MIADLKPYAEYKESGLPWLGQVPGHWTRSRVKNLARPGYGTFIDGDWIESPFIRENGIRLIQTGNIGVGLYREKGYRYIDEETFRAFGCTEFQPGDVLICRLGDPVGRACLAPNLGVRMITSVDVCILKAREAILPALVVYMMSAPQYLHWVGSLVRGSTRDRVSRSMLGSFIIPLPPPDEQAAIVRFLDWANGRLERAIRAKRKVIALLGEQKQAIIHRAVTRGLDPSVPLKPSGIPWLGDIPQHWEVLPLKGICRVQSGITLGKDYAGQALREYPYLRVANVQAGHVNLSVVKTIRVTTAEADRCMLQGGDVLMTEGGDLDKLGRGCVWDAQISPCLHQNHVFAVRPNQSRLDPRFLSALLGTSYARAYFQSTAKQTTNLAATNKTKLGMFKVLLPEVDEQHRILSRLDEELRPTNVAASRLEREIELLREYRTRLVADVVTGKLDVREAAARLPDEAPLDMVEDDAEFGDETEAADEGAAI